MSRDEEFVHSVIKEVIPHFSDGQLKIVRAILNRAYSQGQHDALMDTLKRVDSIIATQHVEIEEV